MSNGNTVQAVIENVANTRTSVNDGYQVVWSADDKFDVWNGDTFKGVLKLKTGAGTTSASYDDFDSENPVNAENGNMAFFPSNENQQKAFVFKTEYNSLETDAPMLGSFDGNKFTFTLLAAMVRVVVDNVPAGEISFTISSKDNLILTGEAALDEDGKLSVLASGATSVSVNFTTTEAKTLTFDVPIPIQDYTNGLNVVVKSGANKILDKTTNRINASAGILYLFNDAYVSVSDAVSASTELAKNEVTAVKVANVEDGDNITIPAKSETSADVMHTIDLSDATLPTSGTVNINVTKATDDTTVKKLTVVVPDGTSESSLNINAPGTTVIITSENGTVINMLEATTADNTLIIGKGVSVGSLTVNAGNVRIEGGKIVTSITNAQNKEIVYVIADNEDLQTYQELNQTIKDAITKIECTLDDFVVVNSAAELYAASKGTKNIKIGTDITIEADKPVNPMNGQTYDLDTKTVVATNGSKDVFRIEQADAVVTIKNGTIDNQTGNNYALSIRANNVTLNMENVTIPANDYDGSLHKNGSFEGCIVNLTGCEFNGIVYLSNEDDNTANTLTVTGGSFTSTSQNCFELLNTNLTMSGATLHNNVTEQSYQKNGNEGNNFSKPLGYCIAFTNIDGVAATGSATLSDNTYNITDEDGDYIFNQMDGATLKMEVSRFNEFATVAAAGGEIKLLNDIENAEGLAINKNLVVDFNSKTYTMNKPGTGSAGTQTLGFQLLQGKNVTFKNGTINCSEDNKNSTWNSGDTEKGIAMMIQNYANLTLEDMTIDGTNIAHNGNNMRYIVSNNSGTVNLAGETSITALDKDVAFDVCQYETYDAPVVNVNTTGTIKGLVEVSGGTLKVTAGTFKNESGHCVKVVNGTANFNGGNFTAQEVSVFNMAGTVNITDGTFTSKDNAVISGNGTNDDKYQNGTIEISGGTFNANILTEGFVACGIYHPQKGSLKVTGGTFNIKNGCGILMRGGELDMTGSNASFTFTGDAGEETLGKVGDSRVVVPCGKKIVKDAYSGYYDADNIKITVDEAGDIYDVTGNQN